MRDWETTFARWASPPSESEEKRIANTIRAIRQAIDNDAKLAPLTKVYVQGSYRNRVNVRQDSDVDVGVLYTGNSFGTTYPAGVNDKSVGNELAAYTYSNYKDEIGRALVKHFGTAAVKRSNKAFDIHETSYRLDADVVPTFVHRRYRADGDWISGVQFQPDDGGLIINWPERLIDDRHWPEQHYENGVAKNTGTSRAYKGVVRILKTLRNEMDAQGVAAAKPLFGFLIECLVWNVPNDRLMRVTWDATVQSALGFLWTNTKTDALCNDWGEVSEWKYLFRAAPSSKREQAFAFVDAAWSYIGVR